MSRREWKIIATFVIVCALLTAARSLRVHELQKGLTRSSFTMGTGVFS
jgi:hypothetical protein